jgi:dienelactone hydrolase
VLAALLCSAHCSKTETKTSAAAPAARQTPAAQARTSNAAARKRRAARRAARGPRAMATGERSAARRAGAHRVVARRSASRRPPATEGPFAVDPSVDLRPRWAAVPGRTWQQVSYRGAAGDRVPALYREARGAGKRPAVILGHGHGGDARSMARFFGGALSRRVHVLAVNHPYHGHGRRVPGEDICPRDARKLVRRWIRAVRDLRHAVRVLAAREDVAPQRIGYVGFSLGACLGGLLASHEPRLRAAALLAPAADWSVLARTDSAWHLGWRNQPLGRWLRDPALRKRLAVIDPARTIAQFAPRPLLVVVGKKDRVIRPAAGLALKRAAGKGARLIRHAGGHAPDDALRRRVARWIEKQLR